MGWINGARAARDDIEFSPGPLRREDDIRRLRDNAAACRGTGAGGWSDEDIDDYVSECNRQLHGGGR